MSSWFDTCLFFCDGNADEFIALSDFVQDIRTLNKLPEDGVPAVEVRLGSKTDKKLTAVGVGTRICHGKCAGDMSVAGKFVGELVAGSASSRAGGVAALCHEAGNHAVEGGVIVETFSGKEHEVIYGSWDVLRKKFQYQSALIRFHYSRIFFIIVNGHRRRRRIGLAFAVGWIL